MQPFCQIKDSNHFRFKIWPRQELCIFFFNNDFTTDTGLARNYEFFKLPWTCTTDTGSRSCHSQIISNLFLKEEPPMVINKKKY